MRPLGIHALVWTDATTQAGIETAMERTAEAGYGLIELPVLDPSRFDIPALARRRAALGLSVAVSMGLPEQGDVSSLDPAIRQNGAAILDQAVSVTRDLGGSRFAGVLYSAHGKYRTLPTRANWDHSTGVLAEVAGRAKDAGVTILIEAANRFETNLVNTAAQALAYIADSGSDNIRVHLDTFHMNIEEPSPAAAIRLAGDQLGYVHVGESYRGCLGTGTLDFRAIFGALVDIGYDDWLTFESFAGAVVDDGMALACGIWRDTWVDAGTVARSAKAYIDAGLAEATMRARVSAQGQPTPACA